MFAFLRRLFGRPAQDSGQEPVMAPPALVAEHPRPAPIPATLEWPEEPAPPPVQPVQLHLQLPDLSGDVGMVPSLGNPAAFMIGLVGEQHHVLAVAQLQPGAHIELELEPDNPDDSAAIAAVDGRGRVIGYVAPDCWLRDAVYGGGANFAARVLAVEMGSRGFREVVLEVEPSEEPLRERHYQF